MRQTAFALLLYSIYASAAQADSNDELEVCEEALQILVAKLEVDGKLNDANRIEKLPEPYADYSTCVVPTDTSTGRDEIAYFVFRYTNDVTVFVHRVPVPSSVIVLHGPFHSTYRK